MRSWTNTGFWVLLGMVGGMLLSDILAPRTVQAVATSQSDNYLLASGNDGNTNSELIWLLDYKGARLIALLPIVNNREAGLVPVGELDLQEALEIGRGKPQFLMVTGRTQTGSVGDFLYLAETTSGTLLGIRRGGVVARRNQPPAGTLVVAFKYVFKKDA